MILQALVSQYEALAERGQISRPGWAQTKISHGLEIDDAGALLALLPLKSPDAAGKKPVPRLMELPAFKNTASSISSKFLWNTAEYCLGLDTKGNSVRTAKCFEAAKALHLALLQDVDDPFARAICAFFEGWNPDEAAQNPFVAEALDDLAAGGNLVFIHKGHFPADNPALRAAWQRSYDGVREGAPMRCLITGEQAVPEKTHPSIKGVRDAQSVGAALVSFNAQAFWSFGREQNLNAPVGKYAAFAYTTALNHLLSRRAHRLFVGDSTVVFWAENAEDQYADCFSSLLNASDTGAGDDTVTDKNLEAIMKNLAEGRMVDWDGLPLRPGNRFYVLGLAPNAARVSVRFFLQGSFGDFVRHTKDHYDRLHIVKPHYEKEGDMPLWKLMRETVNPKATDKKSSPQMSGDTLRAILTGARYPATLYQSVQLRIRAEGVISYRRAAILKAYLLRNTSSQAIKEVLTVELNTHTTYQPYILGRIFATLEGIQEAANPGINTTIRDKYLTSACATPAMVFPILLNLAQKHLRKIDIGLRIHLSQQLGELTALVTESFPAHHGLEDQGIFQLGYYHQRQNRFEGKKEK